VPVRTAGSSQVTILETVSGEVTWLDPAVRTGTAEGSLNERIESNILLPAYSCTTSYVVLNPEGQANEEAASGPIHNNNNR